jgi:hypothetical protein
MEPPEYKSKEALFTVIRLSYFPAAYLTYVVRRRWPRSEQKHKDSHTSQKGSPVDAVRMRRVRMMTKKWRNSRPNQEPSSRPRPH